MHDPAAPSPHRIVVELDAAGPPISGHLNPASSIETRPFTGWISLLSALTEAIEEVRARSEGEASTGGKSK